MTTAPKEIDADMALFSERLKSLMTLANLTQSELSRRSDISKFKIWNMLVNGVAPKLWEVKALCSIFGTSSDYLLGISTHRAPPDWEVTRNQFIAACLGGMCANNTTTITIDQAARHAVNLAAHTMKIAHHETPSHS